MTSHTISLSGSEDTQAPQIATFWRRTGANVVDVCFLGAIGACLGFLWFDQLAALGRMGRVVGGAIALVYFGVLNSRIGKGQTFGKRLLNIRVTDSHGALVSPPRSVLRATILLLPFALNGTATPPGPYEQFMSVALSMVIVGVGAANAYLYCSNRRTGQALHDLAVGTFVRNADDESEIHTKMWRPHLAIVGVLTAIILGVVLLPYPATPPDLLSQLAEARGLAQSVVPDAHVSIWRQNSKAMSPGRGQGSASWLEISVEVPVKPEKFETLADNLALAMFRSSPNVGNVGQVVIVVSYGYDIMISHVRTTKVFAHTPQEWLQRLKLDESNKVVPSA